MGRGAAPPSQCADVERQIGSSALRNRISKEEGITARVVAQMQRIKGFRGGRVGLGIFVFVLLTIGDRSSTADEVIWGFEGVVTRVGSENAHSQLIVGSRFNGTLRFNSEPAGTSLYEGDIGLMRSFAWNGPSIGLDLTVAGLEFSTSGRSDSHFGMNVRDGQFAHPQYRFLDSLLIEGASDLRHDPIPPGQVGTGAFYYVRNIGMEFHDFDLRVFSDVSLQTVPPDLSEMEIATINAGVVFGEGRIPTTFGGTVDRIYVVPEVDAGLLLGTGLIVVCMGFAFSRRMLLSRPMP
jgi:hypothetical protein